MPQILCDHMPFEYTIEESSDDGKLIVRGVFQRANVINENGRVYPRAIWEKVLRDRNLQRKLAEGSMLGELDHPADGKTKLQRVSHCIKNLQMDEDGNIIGEAVVFPTPNGKILKSLFESGAKIGISSRGSGSLRTQADGTKVVSEDFKLITFDFVANPSTPGAHPEPVYPSRKPKYHESAPAPESLVKEAAPVLAGKMFSSDLDSLEKEIDRVLFDVSRLGDELSEETRRSVNEFVNNTGAELISRSVNGGSEKIQALLDKLDRVSALLSGQTMYEVEETTMNREEEIRNRIEEAILGFGEGMEPDEGDELSDEELAEALAEMDPEEALDLALELGILDEDDISESFDDSVEELANLDDEDLLTLAVKAGLLSEEDAVGIAEAALEEQEQAIATKALMEEILEGKGEDETEDAEEIIQDLVDGIEELGAYAAQLEEALEQMAEYAELAEGVEELALKYETSLNLLSQLTEEMTVLVEAVGGADKAQELMEAYLEEHADDSDDSEGLDESKVSEYSKRDDKKAVVNEEVNEMVMLAESAIKRLGLR